MFSVAVALLAMAFASGCTDRDNPTASERTLPSGQQLFVDNCASCHGIDGRGDGPLAAQLRVAPVNLRLLTQDNDGKYPSRRVQRSIDGRGMLLAHGLPEMPIWGAEWKRQGLSEAQVGARTITIASYIRTLQD